MKLVIMTSPSYFVEEDQIISALYDEGMDCLHLAKADADPQLAVRLLRLMPAGARRRTVVHGLWELKDEMGLAGLHIDDAATPAPEGYRGQVTRTCHRLDELREAKRKAKYVLLSGVFDSASAPGDDDTPVQAFTLRQLEEARRQGLIDRHVYAMGGMTADRVALARELGFGGVVVRGDLWSRFDIHRQQDFGGLVSHFAELRRAVD